MEWWHLVLIIIGIITILVALSSLFYSPFFKRIWDIVFSGCLIVILVPVFVILSILGIVCLRGNPFFVQERPGKNERIFKLIKFRSMSNKTDEEGILLPDAQRLGKYGHILRATSLDELPELFNIFIGNMSFVGPRPLRVHYLRWYSEEQSKRHLVRPGLTGYSQVNGRNSVDWDKRLEMDVDYVKRITLLNDIKIIIKTIVVVVKREGVNSSSDTTMGSFVDYCKNKGRRPRE